MMNRRNFLGSLFKATVVAAIAPSILAEVQAVEDGWKIYRIDGFTIRMKILPAFDVITQIGFPLESQKIVFIDEDEQKTISRKLI